MFLRRKKGANDDSYLPETHSSWKGKLGQAFGIGKKSTRIPNRDSTISFMDVDPFIENAASSSAFPTTSTTPHPTSAVSKSLYRLSHMAKSATNLRHLFSDSDAPEPDLAEFNPPVSTPVSHSGSVSSAYFSTYSRYTLKSALVPSSSIDSQSQSPFAETHFPVDLGGQPGRPLVYNVESWNVGRIRVGVEPITRSLSSQKSARKIVEETLIEAGLLAQRTGEVERLPLSWETDQWDDSTSAILMSWLGYSSDFEVWGSIAFDGHQAVSPFEPRALPGVVERSRPGVVAGPRAHYRSPSADLVDALPRRRQHSGSTVIQTNIPPTTPTTPKFPPSGRYISDPDDTPRAPARVRAIERGSPTPSSICLPNEVSSPPRGPGDDVDEIEGSLWLVAQDAVTDKKGQGLGNEVEHISPRAFMEDVHRSPSMRSAPGHATGILLEAANILSPAASTELHFDISQAASSRSAIPHGTQSSQDARYSDPHVYKTRIQPEGTIAASTTTQPPNILMFPWRTRQQVRRVSVEFIDVILTNLESRAPNFPPINLPQPLDEQFVHASRSVKYWFVPPPEPYSLSRISGPVSFFWARFDEGWTTHVPASWDDIESSQMTHVEQVAYYRKKMGELREADRREEERYSRNARYLVERKRRGLPIVPDPHAPPPSFPPRVTPYLYGKDIETRLHRRARGLRQMVWNVDRRSISEVVLEEEKFVGWTYRRTIGKRWAWRKEKADSAKSQADAVRRQLSRSKTVLRRPDPDDEDLFDDWVEEDGVWDAAADDESALDGKALSMVTDKGPHETVLRSNDVAIGSQHNAADGQMLPEGAQESKAGLRGGPKDIAQTIVALQTIVGEQQPGAADSGVLPLQPTADIFRHNDKEGDEAVQVKADGKATDHGSSSSKVISPFLTPIRHAPIPHRARHSRNRHSLVDLQLELDKQAAEVADELNILATIAFPLVPRRNSTGEVPEEVRVEVVPPTPMATKVLLMNSCQTAEALWHPDEQVGEDIETGLTGWPAATRVGRRQEQGLLAIPSCAGSFGDEMNEDEGSTLIDLGAGDGEDDQVDEFWTEVSEVEESRLMECAMRDGEGLTALEDVPRIGESLVGSALAWWQAGGVSVGDPSGCWPKGQEGQAMDLHEERAGGQKAQDEDIYKASASASGGSGEPEMESGEQAAEQVRVDYKGKDSALDQGSALYKYKSETQRTVHVQEVSDTCPKRQFEPFRLRHTRARAQTSTASGVVIVADADDGVLFNTLTSLAAYTASSIHHTHHGDMSIETDLWADILSSADRGSRARNAHRRKNVILLSERHRGRTYLLQQLSAQKKGGRKVKSIPDLAVGYHVLEVKEDGDEDSVPPVSVFYPPSSQENLLKLVPKCLPPESIMDTAVVIALDWSKPSTMVRELLTWLRWVSSWVGTSAKQDEQDELRERLQHHVQNYSEPSSSTSYQGSSSYAGSGAVLPLGQGVLTMNLGIPIVVVCTRADRMDVVGDELGMKGQWEERTDWVQQALRTICLSYGAALFYTSTSQPQTYTSLRQYLLHRLFTSSPATRTTDSAQPAIPTSSPFAFPHKANVLDRDAVMVPTGWDSYGKISVLRDRFDAGRVYKAWESSLQDPREEGVEGIEDVWDEVISDTTAPKVARPGTITSTSESEQTFLSRQLDILQKDPNRDPRASFRQAAAAVSAQGAGASADGGGGVVGPMGAGGLSLPGVEKVMAEMEGSSVEDMKEKFARLGRRDGATKTGPLSPTGEAAKPAVPNEALHNFFQGLLATKGKSSASPSSKSPSVEKPT